MAENLESQVGRLLLTHGKTICTAESCTGGLVAHRLTNVSGSSIYILGGVVAYANAVKQAILGVSEETLIAHGAVSEAVAGEMAVGARRLLGADIAISVTGIAGPSGGTAQKPVGLTYIGLADANGIYAVRQHIWSYDREGNKSASADAVFILIIEYLRK
jgi:PncC family amidohydrolase